MQPKDSALEFDHLKLYQFTAYWPTQSIALEKSARISIVLKMGGTIVEYLVIEGYPLDGDPDFKEGNVNAWFMPLSVQHSVVLYK